MIAHVQAVFRLGLKELYSLGRDTALVLLIIYAFTYAVFGPARGSSTELRNASVAIVDEDRSALSAHIRDALLPPQFQPPRYIGIDQIDAAMEAGRFTFVIDIPPRFQADVAAGRRPTLQVDVDATAMSQAGRGAGYIENIVMREVQRFVGAAASTAQPVQLVTVTL